MNELILTTLIAVPSGVASYLITTFWMKPILHYKELRQQIISNLIFYANVVIPDGLNDRAKESCKDRIAANRRHAAELTAYYDELPYIYKALLEFKGLNILSAARNLIGYSNTANYDDAEKRVNAIKNNLGFKSNII